MQMTVCTRNLTKEFITKVNSLFKPKKGWRMFHPPMDSGRRLADETSPPFFRFKQAIDFCNKFLGQVSSANCHLHRSSVIKRYLKCPLSRKNDTK